MLSVLSKMAARNCIFVKCFFEKTQKSAPLQLNFECSGVFWLNLVTLDAVGGAKVLELSFTWLKDAGRDSVSGYTERIRLPYEPFRSYVAGEGETVDRTRWRLLSILEQNRPKLEFQSRKNLKAVVENPILRHKLGKFLDQHFNWYNYERIVLTDDYLPYSFFFEGYMVQGAKTCGGVILHGEENIQTAKYGIHT